jgi:hypothetical protein
MLTKTIHDKFVYNRRMAVLSDLIGGRLHDATKVLDVGCGDGKIDSLIMQKNKCMKDGGSGVCGGGGGGICLFAALMFYCVIGCTSQ